MCIHSVQFCVFVVREFNFFQCSFLLIINNIFFGITSSVFSFIFHSFLPFRTRHILSVSQRHKSIAITTSRALAAHKYECQDEKGKKAISLLSSLSASDNDDIHFGLCHRRRYYRFCSFSLFPHFSESRSGCNSILALAMCIFSFFLLKSLVLCVCFLLYD